MLEKIKYWKNVAIIKTLYYCFQLKVLRNKQLILYPKTKLFISRTAKIYLGKGYLVCNFSHFGTRFRRYTSILCLGEKAKLYLKKNTFTLCEGASIIIRDGGCLVLKGKSYINELSKIDCSNRIEIGENTIISSNVYITDSDIHTIIGGKISKPIFIGDNVWIGDSSKILKGVTIGNGAVVAAGAIVTSDIPANCLVGGIPAKIIRKSITWQF